MDLHIMNILNKWTLTTKIPLVKRKWNWEQNYHKKTTSDKGNYGVTWPL